VTTAPTIEELTEQGQGGEPRSWFDIAVGFSGEMVHPVFRRGDLAELRRMKPEEPDAAIFWRLLARQGLLEGQGMSRELESKWGLILHGIALMTPTVEADSDSARPRSSAHDPTVPVGLALFQGGDGNRTRAFYSESRLNRLLTARGPMLHTLLARTFRMLGTDQAFNWRQMEQLILHEGFREDSAERVRHQIARAYYQAERRSTQAARAADE
jgi:CRISPR type I-E-associated protein CasB/Cse2